MFNILYLLNFHPNYNTDIKPFIKEEIENLQQRYINTRKCKIHFEKERDTSEYARILNSSLWISFKDNTNSVYWSGFSLDYLDFNGNYNLYDEILYEKALPYIYYGNNDDFLDNDENTEEAANKMCFVKPDFSEYTGLIRWYGIEPEFVHPVFSRPEIGQETTEDLKAIIERTEFLKYTIGHGLD